MRYFFAAFLFLAAGMAFAQSPPQATGGKPAQEGTPQPPKRIRIGGNVTSAKLVSQIPPVYPPIAKQARISGTVRLQVIIARDGSVAQIQLISGHPLLVQSALDAVRQWRYQPTLLNGTPVEVESTVDVVFSLANNPTTSEDDSRDTITAEQDALSAVDPATAKDIRRLLEATGAKEIGMQVAEPLVQVLEDNLLAGLPPGENREKIAKRVYEKVMAIFASDENMNICVSIYAKRFSHDEIIGILSFYESPLGKRLLEETPALVREVQTASGRHWSKVVYPRLVRELKEEFPELAKAKQSP